MVQRLDKKAIKELQEHPENFLYIRPPTEEDFLFLDPTYHRVLICGRILLTSWYGGDWNVGWENLQIQHIDWMVERNFRGIHIMTGDTLQVKWGFTIS